MTNEAPAGTKEKEPANNGKALMGTRVSGLTRLVPQNFTELEHIAQVLANSDIVPKDLQKKAANVLLVLMFGNEIGLTPAQSLQNVMVVNGRPSLWGDAVMGLVEQSGLQESWSDHYDPKLDGGTWTFTTTRKGRSPVTRTFSEIDAVSAKLAAKAGPWQEYKPRMKFHRARSWALRDTYPDALKGLRYFEEERDVIETTAVRVEKDYSLPKERAPEGPASNGQAGVGGLGGTKAEDAVIVDAAKAGAEKAAAPAPTGAKFKIAKIVSTTIEVNKKEVGVFKITGVDHAAAYLTEDENVAKLAKKIKDEDEWVNVEFDFRENLFWVLMLERAPKAA